MPSQTNFLAPACAQYPRRGAWMIVVSSTLMMAVTYGLMYSFSVFFKPLAEHFQWDRATVSLIYSASLVIRGGVSIGTGWLADRYGATRLMVFCGMMIALGLVLSSQVNSFWQLFVSYSLIEAIGLSGTFGVTTAVTSRWFTNNRGLALGLVSSGVGIGTLILVPGAERLIQAVTWPNAFLIFGLLSGFIVVIGALFLKSPPVVIPSTEPSQKLKATLAVTGPEMDLKQAIISPRMITVILLFALLFFCTQMVMSHLVNYATDLGITSLAAAGLISLIGVVSIAGRLVMGAGSDKLGMYNIMVIVCLLMTASLVGLIFARQLWEFYFFAILFGFAYGGEVPQIALFVGSIGGTKSLATLIGLTLFLGNIGGALGPWTAGKIFDVTANYQWAYTIGAVAALLTLVLAIALRPRTNR